MNQVVVMPARRCGKGLSVLAITLFEATQKIIQLENIVNVQKQRLGKFAKKLVTADEQVKEMAKEAIKIEAESRQRVTELKERMSMMRQETTRLRIAVNDAIRRPLGVVPDSAIEFYNPAQQICPRCGNGDVSESHNFCVICGLPVYRQSPEVFHGL